MQATPKKETAPLENIRFAVDDLHMLLSDFRRSITEIEDALLEIDAKAREAVSRTKTGDPIV